MASYARVNYEELWRVLADLLTELRERGEAIPNEIMKDLRSAKTMIQILRADPTNAENLLRAEMYLENVESYLVFAAEAKLGSEEAERWTEKLGRARMKTYVKGRVAAASRFVPGLPRGKPWIRIQVSKENPREAIERLAKEEELSCRMQEDGYVLVYGDKERIRSLVKRIARKSVA